MRKYKIVLKVLAIVAVLLGIRAIIDFFNLDVASASTMVSALVGGVIFTIAIIFAGTLGDYKESEKIPGELASSLKAIYQDSKIVQVDDDKLVTDMRSHVKELLHVINSDFRGNSWKLEDINPAIDKLNEDVTRLAKGGVAAPLLVRLRSELTNVDKLSNRVEIITKTSFIPAAYAIAELAVGALLILLLFVKVDPPYEGFALIGVISALLVGLMLLINDMDNPFEYDKNTYADVDLALLLRLEEYLDSN